MEFKEMISKAVEIREKYSELEKELYGNEWSREEIALGFAGDVGDLMKLIIANEGKRDMYKVIRIIVIFIFFFINLFFLVAF